MQNRDLSGPHPPTGRSGAPDDPRDDPVPGKHATSAGTVGSAAAVKAGPIPCYPMSAIPLWSTPPAACPGPAPSSALISCHASSRLSAVHARPGLAGRTARVGCLSFLASTCRYRNARGPGGLADHRPGKALPGRQMGEELPDFALPHLQRVPLAVEQDVPSDPEDVGLLGRTRAAPEAQGLSHLVEQLLRRSWRNLHVPACDPRMCVVLSPQPFRNRPGSPARGAAEQRGPRVPMLDHRPRLGSPSISPSQSIWASPVRWDWRALPAPIPPRNAVALARASRRCWRLAATGD